jgi:preprotein translocase subunit SecA
MITKTLKLAVILNFGIDTEITAAELEKGVVNVVAEKLYNEAKTNYNRKVKAIAEQTFPIIKNIARSRAIILKMLQYHLLMDEKLSRHLPTLIRQLQLREPELPNALERSITLALIDDAWKEHLRAMDDLRHSVQTAGYEQKDPLVIYKIEAFGAFKQMDDQVNKDIVSFLCHCAIPDGGN